MAAHILRDLKRQPFVVGVPIVILALGIAAVTATQVVFNSMLFTPLAGVVDADQVVSISFTQVPSGGFASLSSAEFARLRTDLTTVGGLGGWSSRNKTTVMRRTGEGLVVTAGLVSSGFFDALGVRARLGRLFNPGEADQPGVRLAVISERLWEALYGKAARVLDDDLLIDGDRYTVIGVVSQFRGVMHLWHTDVWVPFAASGGSQAVDRAPSVLIGRMRPGSSAEAVRAQVARTASGFQSERRLRDTRLVPIISPGITEQSEQNLRLRLAAMYRLLVCGAVLLLVLATANAANLLIARQIGQRDGLALRAALGASRTRLFFELLRHSALIAAVAGGVGFVGGVTLARLFRGLTILPVLSPLEQMSADWRVVAVTALAACAAFCLVGIIPALLGSRVRPADLHGRGTGATPKRNLLRNVLMGFQVAVALALVATTGILTRTVMELRSAASGFDPAGVVQVTLSAHAAARTDDHRDTTFRQLLDRVRAENGVESVASAEWTLSPGYVGGSVQRAAERTVGVQVNVVSEDYFRTLHIPILAGRTFTREEVQTNDGRGRSDLIVISERLARQAFGTGFGDGHLRLWHRPRIVDARLIAPLAEQVEVIGIVGDARLDDVHKNPLGTVYRPGQPDWGRLLVRLASGARGASERLGAIAAETVPGVRVDLTPLRSLLDDRIREELLLARASAAIAGLAGTLACVGIASVVAFIVAGRKRDIAIRQVLGASSGTAAVAVLRGVLIACAGGASGGIALFVVASRLLEARVYGISPLDGVTLAFSVIVLGATAFVSAWLPASAVSKADLATSLRRE